MGERHDLNREVPLGTLTTDADGNLVIPANFIEPFWPLTQDEVAELERDGWEITDAGIQTRPTPLGPDATGSDQGGERPCPTDLGPMW